MRIRRTLPVALAVVLVAAAVTLAIQLRKHAPPEPARLLPGADAFFYANVSWIRKITNISLPPISHDPEYEQFLRETGFDFERDLDSAAFAVHYPAKWPGGGTGGSASEPRFSEVFIGKFNGERLAGYLKKHAQSVEIYHSVDIYTIPIEGRTLRVAILSVDSVAASNHEDPALLRGMVDRSRRLASPFGGPSMLRHFYKRVQLASPVWLIARVEPSAPEFSGWSAVFPAPATLVVSASYNPLHLPLRAGALHVRAEAWTASTQDARAIADKTNVFLAMFNSAEKSVGSPGSDADLKFLFNSLEVRQENSHAVLQATVPTTVFHKLMQSPDQVSPPGEPSLPSTARSPKTR
jgi:hypothetical protein